MAGRMLGHIPNLLWEEVSSVHVGGKMLKVGLGLVPTILLLLVLTPTQKVAKGFPD